MRHVIENMKHLPALLGLAAVATAAEYAVLETGFVIRADRHEIKGELLRLYRSGGTIEIPARSVVRFEAGEPAPGPASQPAAPPEASPTQAPADPKELVERAARKYGLPPALLHSVAAVESAYDPKAVSPKGAIGLMQLMPATAERLKADPADPAQNVDAAARHLRRLLERYGYGLYRALAAYNAGEGAVDRYGWIPPYPETERYVARVAERFQRLTGGASRAPLQRGGQTR